MQTTAASEYPVRREFDPTLAPAAGPDAVASVLSLGVSGLDASELDMLGSILRVLEQRTTRPWRLCAGPEADLFLHTRDGGIGPHRGEIVGLIVRDGEAPAPQDTIALQAPFRVMSVLDVLNDAYDRLIQRRHPRSAIKPPVKPSPIASDDGKSLASALARIVERRLEQNLRIRIVGFGTLYLCPNSRVHCIDFPRDRLRAALDEHRFVVTTLAQGSPELAAQLAQARPIDEVLWSIGLAAAWERSGLDGLRFKLRRWPDLARLPHRAEHIALCATLAARACTRAELAAATGTPATEVTHFLHACELCGLTQSEPDASDRPVAIAAAPNGLGGLFDRLRRRLGF